MKYLKRFNESEITNPHAWRKGPETEKEILLYEGALRRRQLRLVLGGRMKVQDAVELRALFETK